MVAPGFPLHLLRSLSRFQAPRRLTARPSVGSRNLTRSLPARQRLDDATPAVRTFADFPLHPELLQKIEHPSCTEIQSMTLPVLLEGRDVLAQAKTGTGKTAAFLIPTLSSLLNSARSRTPGKISVLIVSPTRELASQIAREAVSLAPVGISVVTVFGATNVKKDIRNLQNGCDILVGTPGRLNDLLENYDLRARLEAVKHVILDEGDTLLDQGFLRPLERILSALPNRRQSPRQTVLFSATVPRTLESVISTALLPGYASLSSIKPEDANTHERVPQEAIVVPPKQVYAAALVQILEERQAHPETFKIMVFSPTAHGANIFYEALQSLPSVGKTWEIQSRMSQSAREQAAAAFKACKSGILVSSDVTARGLDFPLVTLVLQVGVPSSPEQYIHRLGRTARAGADGRGSLVLTPDERPFLAKEQMQRLPLQMRDCPADLGPAQDAMSQAMTAIPAFKRKRAAAAHLGYYKSVIKDRRRLIELSRIYAVDVLALTKFPALPAPLIGKMGLKNQGLEVGPPLKDQ